MRNFPTRIIFTVCFFVSFLTAQLTNKENKFLVQPPASQSTLNPQQMQLPEKIAVQDGPVDPKEYVVGPGDVFNVSIWAATPLIFQVPVTPEGTVVIPTVNEVNIAGMTLDSARKIVLTEIRKKYISGNATFTLYVPRKFTVTISGVVLSEGKYIVQATQRVDALLQLANDLTSYNERSNSPLDAKAKLEVNIKLSSYSKRHIKIFRKNGNVVNADFEKYYATQNPSCNPLLQDGDVIIVPQSNAAKDFIGVYGGVAKEGTYEFVEDDSLTTLIAIAGGLASYADPRNTVIARNSHEGMQIQIPVDLTQIFAKQSPDILLQNGDRIIVGKKNSIDHGGAVSIEGEVIRPGSYPIIQDSTMLSEAIEKAGGFTEYASLNGAVIMHSLEGTLHEKKSQELLRRGLSTAEDTTYFNTEQLLKSRNEMTSVDFVELFEKKDKSKDVKLRDGDKIIVPRKKNAVYVFGEVKNPGYVQFAAGKTYSDYIATAGGFTDNAQTGDIKIVKAGSKQWLDPSDTEIQEGDYVWVPKKPYRTTSYYLTAYSQAFAILASITTVFYLITITQRR